MKKKSGQWVRERMRLFLVSSFAFLANTAIAQEVISLDSILVVIRKRNPALLNYDARAEAMRAYSQGAGSWMAPEVGGGPWMVPYKRVSDQRDKGQIMISAQQKFTNPAKLRAVRRYQESKAGIEEEGGSVVYNELRSAATLAYSQWIVYERRKAVLIQEAEIVKLMKTMAEARIPSTQGDPGQVYKADARILEIENMMLENENQIVQKGIILDRLMYRHEGPKFQVDTTWRLEIGSGLQDSVAFASRRSDVRKIDQAIRTIRLNQELESAQSKPDFSLSFNHMIARGTGMPNQFMLLGMISVPIAPWSSKSYKANINGMNKEIQAMQNERAGILNESMGAAAGIKEDIVTLQKQIRNYETRIIPILNRNYESAMRAYQENKQQLSEVLDAWETLNITRLQRLDVILRLNESIVAYKRELEE